VELLDDRRTQQPSDEEEVFIQSKPSASDSEEVFIQSKPSASDSEEVFIQSKPSASDSEEVFIQSKPSASDSGWVASHWTILVQESRGSRTSVARKKPPKRVVPSSQERRS